LIATVENPGTVAGPTLLTGNFVRLGEAPGEAPDLFFDRNISFNSGIVVVSVDVLFENFESYHIYIRNGSGSGLPPASQSVANIMTTAAGSMRFESLGNTITTPYSVGVPIHIRNIFDLDVNTWDAFVNDALVVDNKTIMADCHVGAVAIGFEFTSFTPGPGFDGMMQFDNFRFETGVSVVANLDIKPGSCPNPLNVWPFDRASNHSKPNKGGVLPVAVLGTEAFDVADIDVSTLLLEGVVPLRSNLEDVAAPVLNDGSEKNRGRGAGSFQDLDTSAENDGSCECTTAGPDGYTDLTLKFQKSEIVAALGAAAPGNVIPLTLTGELNDGTPFEAVDCVAIVGGGNGEEESVIEDMILEAAVPNPFNPVTTIKYTILESGHVSLRVFNAAGQLVRTLVDEEQAPRAGGFTAIWDGTSDAGADVASGIYFYRLTAGNRTLTKKMVLLK
jgi:hypothetical protein